MNMTRRKAIALIAAIPFAGAITEMLTRASRKERANETFYDLIARWNHTPNGPDKERLFRESYLAGVSAGILGALRTPQLDKEAGLS